MQIYDSISYLFNRASESFNIFIFIAFLPVLLLIFVKFTNIVKGLAVGFKRWISVFNVNRNNRIILQKLEHLERIGEDEVLRYMKDIDCKLGDIERKMYKTKFDHLKTSLTYINGDDIANLIPVKQAIRMQIDYLILKSIDGNSDDALTATKELLNYIDYTSQSKVVVEKYLKKYYPSIYSKLESAQ